MIYKRVEGIVWNARGGQGRVRPPEVPARAEVLETLAAMVSGEEFDRIYKEWQRGERQIRADEGFIRMTFTPAANAPIPPAHPRLGREG